MKRLLRSLLLLLAIAAAGYSGYHMAAENERYRVSVELYERLSQTYTRPQEQAAPTEADAIAPAPPITVDFAGLEATCPDVIGWLYCPAAGIDHPVVQGEDNEHYLHTLFDGTKNSAGTLFVDHRCAPADPVTIIYGHNMKNGTMFGSLPSANFDRDALLWYITSDGSYAYHVLTGRVVAEDSEIYDLAGKADLTAAQATIDAAPYERYLILSTCSYEYEGARYLVIAGYDP